MSRKQSKDNTSRRTFLTRVGTYAWGAAVSLTSMKLLVRPSRAWAQDPIGAYPTEGSGQPATMPTTQPASQPTSQPTSMPAEPATGAIEDGPVPTRTATATPLSPEEFDAQFELVDCVQEPQTSLGRSTSGCRVRECCSSGDIWVCERTNNGECGESNFCQELNTGDCDRVNGCRNSNSGDCHGNTNICRGNNQY